MVGDSSNQRGPYRAIPVFERRLNGHSIPPFELVPPDGLPQRFPGNTSGESSDRSTPDFRIIAKNQNGDAALASLDEYKIAVAFIDGDIDIEGDFLSAFRLRKFLVDRHPLRSLHRFVRPWLTGQSAQNRKLVPKHYDRGNEFYFTFLDKEFRLYSQALFSTGSESLEQAAVNKLDYICDVCRIGPGTEVLDVGAGWGSFSFYAAERGANVTMLTVSEEQKKYLEAEIERRPTAGRLSVILDDVYAFTSKRHFDAITLLGVMEHLPDYSRLLRHFEDLLSSSGRVYMDFSAIREKYGVSTFTYSKVFEGNGSPVHMPGLVDAANNGAYEIVAVHNDRHSYFLTLKNWAENLEANQDALANGFSESTVRLFRLYLWATAFTLGVTEQLQSYRVVLQKSRGEPSSTVGL